MQGVFGNLTLVTQYFFSLKISSPRTLATANFFANQIMTKYQHQRVVYIYTQCHVFCLVHQEVLHDVKQNEQLRP